MVMGMMVGEWMGKPVWAWGLFLFVVIALMTADLFFFHKEDREIGIRESLLATFGYMTLALLFSGWIGWQMGEQKAVEFLTGYVVELSLSMDNVFVIVMILSYFAIPRAYQHKVLFWGILGLIVMRGVMILLGTVLIQQFHGILYLFAAFLVFSGVKMLFMAGGEEVNLDKNPVLKFMRKYGRVSDDLHGHDFFIRKVDQNTGHYAWYMTRLFLALLVVDVADVIFAVDSVPAIFAITTDPYIVFTSNIFAILGLRSLYFALAALVDRFAYLKYALAVLLIFIGSKMFIVDMLDLTKFPPAASLGITFAILGGGIGYSLWKTKKA